MYRMLKIKIFLKIESKIYQEKHQILKRDITITDSDDKKITIKGTNKIDDDLKVDYKVSSNDNTLNGTSKRKDNNYKDKYTYLVQIMIVIQLISIIRKVKAIQNEKRCWYCNYR